MRIAILHGEKARVLSELGHLEHGAQTPPLFIVACANIM
jgi:hypothetical protein